MELSPPPPAVACRGLTAAAAANSLQSRSAPRSLAVCTVRAGFAQCAPSFAQKYRAGPARFPAAAFNIGPDREAVTLSATQLTLYVCHIHCLAVCLHQ